MKTTSWLQYLKESCKIRKFK